MFVRAPYMSGQYQTENYIKISNIFMHSGVEVMLRYAFKGFAEKIRVI